MNAREEFTRSLTRKRNLTITGIQRMMTNGCDEYRADPEVCVIRVQTAVYCR